MRTCRIGICSRNPEYGASLMMALKRISAGKIEAMVFSRPEVLSECIPVQEMDLLVLDGWEKEVLGQDAEDAGIPVCILTEQPSGEGIFKYRPVREICKDLLMKAKKGRDVSSRPSGCIAVFSPLGRCGKTALARALLRAGSEQDGLYIGMEEYADRVVHSEVLYLVKQRSPDLYEAVLRETISDDGLQILYVSGIFSELRDVQRGDLEWLHEQLLQPGRYRTLVYDVGGASLQELSLLTLFERIYMPVLTDPVSQAKIQAAREQLRSMKLGEVLRRLCAVELTKEAVESGEPQQILACLGMEGYGGEPWSREDWSI